MKKPTTALIVILTILCVPGLVFAQNLTPSLNQNYPVQQFVSSEPSSQSNQSDQPQQGHPAAPQPSPAPPADLIPPLTQGMTDPPDLAPSSAADMTVPPDLAPHSAPDMLKTPDLAAPMAPSMTVPPDLAPPSAPDLVPSPLPAAAPALSRPGPVSLEQAANPADSSPQQVAKFFNGGLVENAFTSCQRMASSFCTPATGDKYQKCISRLKPYPACQQFLAFAGATQFDRGDDVDLIQNYKEAPINLFHVARFNANYPGDYYVIGVKGNFVNITSGPQVQEIDISKDIHYPQITQQFPKAQLWSYVDQPPVAQPLPNGGLRLVFRFSLLDGCASCEQAGYAFIAYDFTGDGQLKQAQLIALESKPVQR